MVKHIPLHDNSFDGYKPLDWITVQLFVDAVAQEIRTKPARDYDGFDQTTGKNQTNKNIIGKRVATLI